MATRRRKVIHNAADCHRHQLPTKCTLNCFIIVIVAILVYQVVLIQSFNKNLTTLGSTASEPDESANLVDLDARDDDGKATRKPFEQQTAIEKDRTLDRNIEAGTNKSRLACEYDKATARWSDCEPDGSQRKVMNLRAGGQDCKPTKTIRRDCEAVGCKYARGQWSSACVNGQRYREDKLVGRIGSASGANYAQADDCKPLRRVTKDCRRTCHYIKSAWSECANGFRTRLLTLDESIGGSSGASEPVVDSNDTITTPANNNSSSKIIVPSGRQSAASKQPQAGRSPIKTTAAEFQNRQHEPAKLSSGATGQESNIESENNDISSSSNHLVSPQSAPADGIASSASALRPLSSASPSSSALLSSRTCARHKLIKRECRRPGAPGGTTTMLPPSHPSGLAGPVRGLRGPQRLHSNTNNMTPTQRRRLKQIQLKQQQQLLQQAKHEQHNTIKPDQTNSPPAPETTTISPSSSSTLGPRGARGGATSSTKKASRSRR